MSDVGAYAAIRAEVVALLAGLSGAHVATAPADLDALAREAILKPAVGILCEAAESEGRVSVAHRRKKAKVTVLVSVVTKHMQGGREARAATEALLEAVRDAVDDQTGTTSAGGIYEWTKDDFSEFPDPKLDGGVAVFELKNAEFCQ